MNDLAAISDSRARATLRWFAAALGLLMIVASVCLLGPQVEVDEGSYLLSAAAIAGRLEINPVIGYYSGYSLLVAPAFLFARNPDQVFHFALIINALLIASVPFALYRLTRTLWPSIEGGKHVIAAAAATCYAPLLMLSQYAMSESVMVAAFAWLLATAGDLVQRPRATLGATLGFLAGGLYLAHPRGAMMAAPVLLVLTWHARGHRSLRAPMAVAWMATLAVAALHAPLERLALKPAAMDYNVGSIFTRLTLVSTWKWMGLNLIGATTEAIVGTLGLLVLALRLAARETLETLRARRWQTSSRAALLVANALSLIAAFVVTAAFFVPATRADMLSYGRYALPPLIPMIAVAAIRLQLASRAERRSDAIWAIAAGMLGIGIMIAAFRSLPAEITGTWNYLNAVELYLASLYDGPARAWQVIGACFVVVAVGLHTLARCSARGATVAFVLCNLLLAGFIWQSLTLLYSRVYGSERPVVDSARSFRSATGTPLCTGLGGGLDDWNHIDLSWRLLDELALSPARQAPCTRGMILPSNEKPPEGMQAVTTERTSPIDHQAITLYVESSESLEAFARVHPLWNPNSIAPLPLEDRRATIAIDGVSTDQLTMRVDAALHWDVRITNRGAHAWPAHAQDGRVRPVLLGATINRDAATPRNVRQTLPIALAPGESTVVPIEVGPFTEAGTYRVHVGIVQEFVAWFETGVDIVVHVTD